MKFGPLLILPDEQIVNNESHIYNQTAASVHSSVIINRQSWLCCLHPASTVRIHTVIPYVYKGLINSGDSLSAVATEKCRNDLRLPP